MYLKIYIVQYDFATLLGLRIKIIYKEFVKRATHRRNSVLVNPVNFVPPEAAGPIDVELKKNKRETNFICIQYTCEAFYDAVLAPLHPSSPTRRPTPRGCKTLC